MLNDPIAFRLWLTDAQFRQRVLQSESWTDYVGQPPIPPFDEGAALTEIAKRNAIRAETRLPILDAGQEVARMREAYESKRYGERFHDVSLRCIAEIYGAIGPSNFSSHSMMVGFFGSKKNLIRGLIKKQSRIG